MNLHAYSCRVEPEALFSSQTELEQSLASASLFKRLPSIVDSLQTTVYWKYFPEERQFPPSGILVWNVQAIFIFQVCSIISTISLFKVIVQYVSLSPFFSLLRKPLPVLIALIIVPMQY